MVSTAGAGPALESIISSYETGVDNIDSFLEATHLVLDGLQESFQATRQERTEISVQLCNTLANNEHLRKKDFGRMMQGILALQEERERDIRKQLGAYIAEQRDMAKVLRGNLDTFRKSLLNGEARRIREFQQSNREMLARQNERREGIISKLREFQEDQRALASGFRSLLVKGRELRIANLRGLLAEFKKRRMAKGAVRQQPCKSAKDGAKPGESAAKAAGK